MKTRNIVLKNDLRITSNFSQPGRQCNFISNTSSSIPLVWKIPTKPDFHIPILTNKSSCPQSHMSHNNLISTVYQILYLNIITRSPHALYQQPRRLQLDAEHKTRSPVENKTIVLLAGASAVTCTRAVYTSKAAAAAPLRNCARSFSTNWFEPRICLHAYTSLSPFSSVTLSPARNNGFITRFVRRRRRRRSPSRMYI